MRLMRIGVFRSALLYNFPEQRAEFLIMLREVEEDASHRFRQPLVVHVIELAIIGACVNDHVLAVQVLELRNGIQLIDQRGGDLQRDRSFVIIHDLNCSL